MPTLAYQKHLKAGCCLEAALALLATSASQAYYSTDRKPPPKLRSRQRSAAHYAPGRSLGRELGRLRMHFAKSVEDNM